MFLVGFSPQYQPGEVLDRAREGGFHTMVGSTNRDGDDVWRPL